MLQNVCNAGCETCQKRGWRSVPDLTDISRTGWCAGWGLGMGCDWSVLSHSNLSAPAAALSLSASLCLCVSLWPASAAAASFLLLLLSAPAAAPECTSTRTRCCLSAHTLPHTHSTTATPITAAATQARPSHCHRCALLLLLPPGLPSNLLAARCGGSPGIA
jgi:hypothetical protein